MFGQNSGNTFSRFGQQGTQQTSTGTGSLFGAGTGVFGGSGFGQGTSFGAGNSVFGQGTQLSSASNFNFGGAKETTGFNAQTTHAFGSQTLDSRLRREDIDYFRVGTPSRGIFGQNATSTGFGNTYGSNTFSGSSLNSRVPTQGTSNPPYQVTQEKETSTGGMQYFQSITCMPAYQAASFEELRLQDYTQNRRFGQQQGLFGSFNTGQTTGNIFGSGNQTYTSQPFGLSSGLNMFSNTQSMSSPFGKTQQNQSKPFGFGTSNTFDTTKNQTGVFSFGNSGNSSQSTFGSSSLFRTGFNNAQNEDNKATTFGSANMGFGQNTTNSFGTGFGTNNTGTNIFGSNQQQSASTPFGQTSTAQNTTSFTFGGNTNTTNNPSTGGMLFGNQVQQQPSTSFGQSLTQNTSSFNFGTPNTANTTTNNVGFSFGQQDNQQNKSTLSFSSNLFGQNNQTQNKPAFSFGNNTGFGQSTASTGLFGANNTNTNSSTGLFGSSTTPASNTNTSFFGNQQSSGNLFGAKPATNTTTSLFGNSSTLQSNTNTGGGLFGNTSVQSSSFKNSNQPLGNSLFGNVQQQQQPLLHASIDKNPFGNNPLFQSSNINFPTNSPGPIATPLVTSTHKKKPAMLPHFKLTPGSSSSSGKFQDTKGVSFSGINSPTIISAASHSLHLFDNLNDETMLNANAFSPRSNIKKLVINRKTSQTNILTGGADLGNFEKNLLKDTDSDKQNDKSLAKQSNGMEEKVADQESPTLIAAKHQNNAKADTTSNVLHNSTEEDRKESNSLSYWTSPSISKLLDYTTDELKHVNNFKVGRKGFGQISFQSPVDLTTFEALEDIPGTIIIFDEKVCTVYPDESLKPPLGCGINVPAIITLERCWPFSKEKREPITDPNHSRFQQHLDRLKRMKETEFIDYIADTGAWVFKVNHFSRWGLLEEDDSSAEKKDQDELSKSQEIKDQYTDEPFYQKSLSSNKELELPAKQTYVKQKKEELTQDYELSTNNESFQKNMNLNKKSTDLKNTFIFQHSTSKIPGSFITENSSEMMNYTIENNAELDISRDESESCDYLSFDDLDNYSNLQTINDVIDTSSIDLRNKDSELYFEDDSKGIASSKKRDNSDDESFEVLSLSSKLPFLQDIKTWPDLLNFSIERFNLLHAPQTHTKKYRDPSSLQFDSPFNSFEPIEKYELQDLDRDLYDQQTLHLPVHASKSHPITTIIPGKFHWGPNNILIIPLNNKNTEPKILLKKIDDQKSISDNIQLALETQLKHTNIEIDEYECPEANPNSTLTSKLFIPFFNNYEANILQLCGILFDEIEIHSHNLQSESQKTQILRMQRKQNLSDWLKDNVATSVENDLYKCADPSSKMFLLLTGYQIEECCLEALKSRNFFLSSLVPLIGGDELIREDCKKQIADWRDSNCLPAIGKYYRAIYELMSGNTETSQGSGMKDSEDYAPDIHISEELDWKRAFGLKLWYELTDEMPIEVAVLSYQRAFNENSTVSSPEISYSKNTNNSDTQEFDILYHLLLLFSKDDYPLENVIDSLTLNFPLDFKIPWLLYIILSRTYSIRHFQDYYTSFSSKNFEENKTTILGNQLTLSFASQLESRGLWHWAIFVLQHLQYAHIRERAIREILARNIADYYNNKQNELDIFLMQSLKIPKIWILESCALYSRYMNYYQSEEKYLLDAKLWNEAHKTLLTFIAPQAVIYSQHDVLYGFLQRFQNTSAIADWKIGGQIYMDYIELLKFDEKLKGLSIIKNDGFRITQTEKDLVSRLLRTLPIMDAKIFEQSVAIKIMSSFSASFILSNNIMINEHSQILQMNLTEDEYFNKIKQLSLEYYKCISTAL